MTEDLHGYGIEHAALRARLLIATAGFHPQDFEDLRQEILLDYLRRAPRFDAARGDREGFARGVMKNQAAVLVVRRARSVKRETLVDDLYLTTGGDETCLSDLCQGSNPAGKIELAIDIARQLDVLPAKARQVAQLLSLMSVSEVCRVTGKSRTRIYQIIRTIRQALGDGGLGPHRGGRDNRRTQGRGGSHEPVGG
jgi:RNA polymerase sigma-70 factor (ECF subfamily)